MQTDQQVTVAGNYLDQRQIVTDFYAPSLDEDTALARYLHHVVESNRSLRLQGIRSAGNLVRIDLEEIYITLTTTVRKAVEDEDTWVKELAQMTPSEAKRRGLDRSQEMIQQVKVQVQEALATHPRLVVLGDPGCGKTMLLRYLLLTFARDLTDIAGLVAERLQLDGEQRLPILLPLRNFGHYLETHHPDPSTDGPKLLLDYLHTYFANQDILLPERFFADRLQHNECAVLLDGVDEVANFATRQRIARLIEHFTVVYPGNRYVVTSRIVGYTGAARLGEGYKVTRVRDFTQADIERFATHWNHAVEVSLARGETPYALGQARRQTRALLAAIEKNERIRELAVNPLLLTVIALVQRYRAQLPERRTELYEEAIEVLLGKWDEAKGLETKAAVAGLELDVGDWRGLLEPVSLWMMEQRVYEIETDELEQQLVQRFHEMVGDQQQAGKAMKAFLQLVEERSGLLVERGQGIYSFSHLTFQEHLAARGVADLPDYVSYTLDRLGDSWWREVILLEVGYLGTQGKRRATALVQAIMDAKKEPSPYHNLVLAAEALRDVGVARVEGDLLGEVRRRIRWELEQPWREVNREVIARRAVAAEALGRIESGILGTQPAFWRLPHGEPIWVDVPAGEFWMGDERYGAEKPVHRVHLEQFQIARVPITNAQYLCFVEATNHAPPRYWDDARPPRGLESHPVVNVSWYDAMTYCRWLSEVTGKPITLPSEAQWEKAARGLPPTGGGEKERAREYPWGDEWDETRCNTAKLGLKGTTPVGIFPEGASPYGALEMTGNVWEWTRSLWGKDVNQPEFKYPYDTADGREYLAAGDDIRRALRGGAFDNEAKDVRCTYRTSNFPSAMGKVIGFRVVISPVSSSDFYQPVNYCLSVDVVPKHIYVGQCVWLDAKLIPSSPSENTFSLSHSIIELYCFITTDGLQIQDTEVIPLPLPSQAEPSTPITFTLQAHLCGERPYTIELFAQDPDSGHISIYKTGGHITVLPPQAIEEHPPILPPLDIRVAPQPDFVLDVTTAMPEGKAGPHYLTYYLSSRLPGMHLRNEKVGSVTLRTTDLTRIRALLQTTLQQTTHSQVEDTRERMLSLGAYLFDRLFPAKSAADFRKALWQAQGRLTTWLIREDGHTWLPWELVVPYRAGDNTPLQCLGERYQLGRWVEGLGPPLYGEAPFGEIALAHYKVLEKGTESQDQELLAWRKLLQAPDVYGILPVIEPETPFYGFHLLRHADAITGRRDIVARDTAVLPTGPEKDAEQARLHLRLKRPVVTLSMLSDKGVIADTSNDDWLLPDRVLPFLRAGASAVTGPWWPTSEAADRIFWPTFYDLLSRRLPLGEVVWRARLAVRDALPGRLDWLAYTLFGDPRARAYWPEPSEGYTVLECLNPDDPLRPGNTYTFRVSIRSRPPTWYKDRLVQTEPLPERMQALFLAPGLQNEFSPSVEMTPLGRTMLQATVDLTPPAPGDYPLLAQLLESEEHVKTLQLTLKVRDAATGGQSNG